MGLPWREPAEESIDLYPGLVVSDDRVTGSITIGPSRLPLWAIIHTAINGDWEDVERGWAPTEHYGYKGEDLCRFLHDLLDQRGEFGRLLLLLANAERVEEERFDALCDATPDGETVPWRPGWWGQPDLSGPVLEQLKRCVEVLES